MYLDVRVVFAGGAPLTSTPLFFAVFVKLGVAEDGYSFAVVDQSHSSHAV